MRVQGWVGLAAASLLAMPAAAEVHKCRSADGSLAYQQMPCSASEQTLASGVSTDFPAPNVIERERLLYREAELHKRLEAERDRLSAEAIARISRPEPAVIAPEPTYFAAWPAGGYRTRGPGRAPMHGWARGRRY